MKKKIDFKIIFAAIAVLLIMMQSNTDQNNLDINQIERISNTDSTLKMSEISLIDSSINISGSINKIIEPEPPWDPKPPDTM